ncbi:uncharacterized protein LOC132904342 [Amyelois transitella]|uniref:uncharacterized protein LOC132904342 n=1 Tax=Amyelois transitella TaxID=680683 RepID=UPI00298FDB41|nr:uncharacterized protein LOC132904342 [Amyelois transitella]
MAWPSVRHISLILSLIYLKVSSGQQNGLLNQGNINMPLGSSLPNNLNQIPKCPLHQKMLNGQLCGNTPPPNLQQLSLQQAALQQQFNLQQAANMQQVSNLQSAINSQANLPQMNVPTNVNQFNLQQPGNLQQLNMQQAGNLQQLNMQQLQQPNPNLQLGFPPNNIQQNLSPNLAGLQLANSNVPDFSFASSPVPNNQFSGISPQMTQSFPDASMISPIAPTMSYSFHPVPQPMGYPNNQQIINPTTSFTPISDLGTINNQQYALVALPIQNQRAVNVVQPTIPNTSPGLPNQVTIIKSVQPQGYFDPNTPSSDLDQNKLSLLSSLISDTTPSQFPSGSPLNSNSILGAALSKAGSKSSNLQALLPLIFNLLKEKNNGCSCHHCGCTNNKQEPQIFTGYANQNNYSHETTSEPSKDNEDIEETTESPETKIPEVKKKLIKENTINNTDSSEYESDSDDNYDDEE